MEVRSAPAMASKCICMKPIHQWLLRSCRGGVWKKKCQWGKAETSRTNGTCRYENGTQGAKTDALVHDALLDQVRKCWEKGNCLTELIKVMISGHSGPLDAKRDTSAAIHL